MKHSNPAVDDYIAQAAPFAQPILKRVRKLFHRACPEIQETIKWGMPHFEYQGIVGGMAAFKQHARFWLWKSKLLDDPQGILGDTDASGMGGLKLTSTADLPADDILLDYMQRAVRLNEQGTKLPARKKKAAASELEVPADLQAALKKNKAARATFDNFSPSCRREYIEWITEAKQPATRERRLATTIEWLKAGKDRNWKYRRSKS